ncbi:MAG: zinc ribbon domain-containing protein [Pseudomonadota bacterium]
MPTYVYETIPADTSVEPRRFEVFQRMNDDPLTADPDSGEPVRRIITGGIGIRLKGLKRSTVVNKKSAAATACGCATGKPHRHPPGHTHGPGCGHKH